MTRKERLVAAMRCEEPDTVPIAPRFGWYTDAHYGSYSWMTHLRAGKDFDRSSDHIGAIFPGIQIYLVPMGAI